MQWNKKAQLFGHYNIQSLLFSKFFIRITLSQSESVSSVLRISIISVKNIKQLVISNIKWNCVVLMSIVTQEP
jgi:hypothetical protein